MIPALEPDQRLIALLQDILAAHFAGPILVVDDGTADQTIFNRIQTEFSQRVVVRHHPIT
ncbi:hypothetical protein [Lacticaseibacillus manihotivorans]|uniref:hypothetical protein n=1 Tax=Lacticaseibacillus manihotivorans TaxID=88233 RepID=UPI000B1CF1EE|nr:hypothetical protein [Lacticaseibacillus manihotivorans]